MTKSRKWLTLVTGAVAVAAFALVVSLTSAQTASAHGGPGGLGGRGGPGASDTYLADALDITTAELQTAQQEANDAAIDQALAEGLITQAQADALKQRSGGFWGRGLGHFGLLGADTIDMEALLAEALGISTAELQAARVEAQDAALAAAVEAGNITQEQADQMKAQHALQNYLQEQGLQDKVRSLYEDAVDAAVKAGVITQEQADQILSDQNFGMRGFGPGFGKHMGRGFGPGMEMQGGRGHGHRGFGPGLGGPSSGSSSTTPSTTTPSFFRF